MAWFSGSVRRKGHYKGHTIDGDPVVISDEGTPATSALFTTIRLEDPFTRKGPVWEEMPAAGRIVRPLEPQLLRFMELLEQFTPPGPRYLDLIMEIWARGFEVFLVGGTVRDVIAGDRSNDVDLVTSMPLDLLEPLVASMYDYWPKGSRKNGFIRVGGTPASGDPYIDIKVMCDSFHGTTDAVFGADLHKDLGIRDFACNAIYFDPINTCLIDPSGHGLSDAVAKRLCLVSQSTSPRHRARIYVRFYKFLIRGYLASDETKRLMVEYRSTLAALKSSHLLSYIHTQLLSKVHPDSRAEKLVRLRETMEANGDIDIWTTHIGPHEKDILTS